MPPSLSGNTLGLKFMQRAAAKKAAAQPAPPVPVEPTSQESAVPREDEAAFPIASTSKLPPTARPTITTESSYLAFPILSAAYGATSMTVGSNANGRMSFGEALKPKEKEKEEDMDPAEDDDYDSQAEEVRAKPKKRKEKSSQSHSAAKPDGFRKPAAFDGLPAPIRKRKDPEHVAEVESDVEMDENFADDMIAEARQRRKEKTEVTVDKSPAQAEKSGSLGESGKKKKRKKQKKEVV